MANFIPPANGASLGSFFVQNLGYVRLGKVLLGWVLLVQLIAMFVPLTLNYCLLALPRYEGGNGGSNFKEGGQTGHSILVLVVLE